MVQFGVLSVVVYNNTCTWYGNNSAVVVKIAKSTRKNLKSMSKMNKI